MRWTNLVGRDGIEPPKTVARWAKEGKLPFLQTLGGHRRYPAATIRQLVDELQVQPTT